MTASRGLFGASRTSAPAGPRSSPLKSHDPLWLVVINVAVVTFMWFRHGGWSRAGDFGESLVSLGQLTGLYATLTVLLGLVLGVAGSLAGTPLG